MTGQVAMQILQKPIFGDQTCIEALKLLRLKDRVREAQFWGRTQDWFGGENVYPNLDTMNEAQLINELHSWYEAGYQE
jgi:hypothetical protein